jgi:hypothetical protein
LGAIVAWPATLPKNQSRVRHETPIPGLKLRQRGLNYMCAGWSVGKVWKSGIDRGVSCCWQLVEIAPLFTWIALIYSLLIKRKGECFLLPMMRPISFLEIGLPGVARVIENQMCNANSHGNQTQASHSPRYAFLLRRRILLHDSSRFFRRYPEALA